MSIEFAELRQTHMRGALASSQLGGLFLDCEVFEGERQLQVPHKQER